MSANPRLDSVTVGVDTNPTSTTPGNTPVFNAGTTAQTLGNIAIEPGGLYITTKPNVTTWANATAENTTHLGTFLPSELPALIAAPGVPEQVQEANPGAIYIDTRPDAPYTLWRKVNDEHRTTGWRAILARADLRTLAQATAAQHTTGGTTIIQQITGNRVTLTEDDGSGIITND